MPTVTEMPAKSYWVRDTTCSSAQQAQQAEGSAAVRHQGSTDGQGTPSVAPAGRCLSENMRGDGIVRTHPARFTRFASGEALPSNRQTNQRNLSLPARDFLFHTAASCALSRPSHMCIHRSPGMPAGLSSAEKSLPPWLILQRWHSSDSRPWVLVYCRLCSVLRSGESRGEVLLIQQVMLPEKCPSPLGGRLLQRRAASRQPRPEPRAGHTQHGPNIGGLTSGRRP